MIQWPTNKTPCLSRVKSQIECKRIPNDASYQHQRQHTVHQGEALPQKCSALQIDSLQCQCSSKFNDMGSPIPASMELNLEFFDSVTYISEDYRDAQLQLRTALTPVSCAQHNGSVPLSIAGSEYVEMGKQFDSESEYEIMQPAEKLSSFDPAVIQLCVSSKFQPHV